MLESICHHDNETRRYCAACVDVHIAAKDRELSDASCRVEIQKVELADLKAERDAAITELGKVSRELGRWQAWAEKSRNAWAMLSVSRHAGLCAELIDGEMCDCHVALALQALDTYPPPAGEDCICWATDYSGRSVCGVPCPVHAEKDTDRRATIKECAAVAKAAGDEQNAKGVDYEYPPAFAYEIAERILALPCEPGIPLADRRAVVEEWNAAIEAAATACKEQIERYECGDTAHDERWCQYCENMSDGADRCWSEVMKLKRALADMPGGEKANG